MHSPILMGFLVVPWVWLMVRLRAGGVDEWAFFPYSSSVTFPVIFGRSFRFMEIWERTKMGVTPIY